MSVLFTVSMCYLQNYKQNVSVVPKKTIVLFTICRLARRFVLYIWWYYSDLQNNKIQNLQLNAF